MRLRRRNRHTGHDGWCRRGSSRRQGSRRPRSARPCSSGRASGPAMPSGRRPGPNRRARAGRSAAEIQWNRSRVAGSAPDQTETESSMMLLAAKPATARARRSSEKASSFASALDVEKMRLVAETEQGLHDRRRPLAVAPADRDALGRQVHARVLDACERCSAPPRSCGCSRRNEWPAPTDRSGAARRRPTGWRAGAPRSRGRRCGRAQRQGRARRPVRSSSSAAAEPA